MKNFCVSVFMLAYNQEKYIAQAIDGVLMQRTDFPVELVIGEDHSTDVTRGICKSYAAKHPVKIKLLLNENNLGLGKNYVRTYSECTGKYIAICDGDDYWIDPLKLQKQVDFLESQPDFEIVFTNNCNIYPSGINNVRDLSGLPGEGCFEDLIFQNYIASVTAMFRNRPLSESMKSWMRELPYGDWPTYLWILKDGGKIGRIDEVTAVYRKDFGTSTALRKSRSRIGEINLYILEKLKNESEF
ncbi:MAG: glycosyltransferase, partial [Bacteroidota bacterium]|nr:glycosyltransferase [Bacteroidota bacterium]